ncbi:SRPBCC family protein [Pyxidicoccus trucidator]|uniref:SRPBCC family protein n=1 Tax=Pyxidicoccus trucidator TaxID=2709662 RepID=UPI0013DB4E84|nr:SRPBCC family protein [Pyxidicoccus trucidator]
MADKPLESSTPSSRSARGAQPPSGGSAEWEWHDIETTERHASAEVRRTYDLDDGRRMKQLASAMLGGALLSLGLKSRSLGGLAVALAGGGLIYQGALGRTLARRVPGIEGFRSLRTLGRRRSVEAGAGTGRAVLERSITIQKPGHELYRAWRVAENLSKVMGHFAEVTTVGPDLQHWKVRGPLGRSFEWDSHIVEEHPGEFLRWESMPGAELPNEGQVRFRPAPADWGTVVTLRLRFSPPGGALGDAAMKLLGQVPTALAHTALRRFKSLVETGEIATTRPNPAAREGGYSY